MGSEPPCTEANCTPGTLSRVPCNCRSAARNPAGLFARPCGSVTPKVSTLCGLIPGFTLHRAARLRIINPAPASRTRASAISTATKTLCVRCREPLDPRPPSFNVSPRLERASLSAGASPKKIPTSSATPRVKSRTCRSTPISFTRGSAAGREFKTDLVPQYASSSPAPALASESTTLSVSSCRTTRTRPAPSAARIVNSRVRPVARASSRLATLAHAISRTKPTAPSSTSRNGRTFPTRSSLNESMAIPAPLLASG